MNLLKKHKQPDSAFCRALVRLSATSPQIVDALSGVKMSSYLTRGSVAFLGEASMKKLVTALVALGLVAGCVAPTLAAEHKTKASCEKAHMKWDASTKTCS